ncbi:unnamed protein product [Miscanthus lutarioriparius]|uniref:Uncharacterized protein n=1 Tax=Miscanthus lutarioriparius TaxID=422564 RepID=A0A811QT14_9POAL|nr:unnamed protein product [Miscanthus lutarioriparius]
MAAAWAPPRSVVLAPAAASPRGTGANGSAAQAARSRPPRDDSSTHRYVPGRDPSPWLLSGRLLARPSWRRPQHPRAPRLQGRGRPATTGHPHHHFLCVAVGRAAD